jgi:predicted dehydrogenase
MLAVLVMMRRVSDRIRVGVAGTGFSAASHLDALARLPSVEVVAIAGSDADRAAGIAAEHAAERGYGSHLELLDHPGLDAIHNCTINRLHHEINLAALERGLHVLSEKPLALDPGESGELAAAAERAGVVAAVCFNYRHYPVVAEIRARLESGAHGRPHFVHGAYLGALRKRSARIVHGVSDQRRAQERALVRGGHR